MLTPITFRQLERFFTAVINCVTLFEATIHTGYARAAFTTFQIVRLRILHSEWMHEKIQLKYFV